jgi:polyhydroxyalkanoate synthase
MGRPKVGLSPKDVVWTREKAQVWRYASDKRTRRTPVVIVFSVLGRSYIMDLMPGGSFVERLLDAGLDVFLVDFGVPDAVDSSNTLETYVDNYLPRALQAAMDAAGTDTVDVLGYCFGGLLAALAVAGHPEIPVNSFSTMATPVDFSRVEGVLQVFTRDKLDADDVLDHTGNVPPETIYRMFRTLKPTSDIGSYAMLWDRLWNDAFVENYQAMSMWVRDQVPFPGALARQCVELLLRRNAVSAGGIPLGGRTVSLEAITCPVLNIMAEHDHIVARSSSAPLSTLVGSDDVTDLVVPSGHIGLAVSREAVRTTIPRIIEWLQAHGS